MKFIHFLLVSSLLLKPGFSLSLSSYSFSGLYYCSFIIELVCCLVSIIKLMGNIWVHRHVLTIESPKNTYCGLSFKDKGALIPVHSSLVCMPETFLVQYVCVRERERLFLNNSILLKVLYGKQNIWPWNIQLSLFFYYEMYFSNS